MGGFSIEYLVPITLAQGLAAAIFQRVLMSKSVYQVRRSFQYATLIWFIMVGFLFALAFSLKSWGIDPAGKNIWMFLSDPQLSFLVFPGFKALAACAIVAMGMYTADSYSQAGGDPYIWYGSELAMDVNSSHGMDSYGNADTEGIKLMHGVYAIWLLWN